jgi:tRNA(fMet)-specific endonuclease VapC
MTRYLLDTNTVSHLVRRHPGVSQRVTAIPMTALAISAITEGELLFGLARRPEAVRLSAGVRELLLRLDVLPWDSHVAEVYGALRAHMAGLGRVLAPLDLLIAAHAQAVSAVLVTNDQAFQQVPDLVIEDWVK